MDKVRYLIGKENITDHTFQPYDPLIVDFLDDISSEIRSDKRSLDYPDVVTFGFWCRRSNIEKIRENVSDRERRVGLGRVFHIAPSNVPINFAFSFVFGLLSGNSNIVRVPSKPYFQIDIIIDCIKKLFENEKYEKIRDMTAFIDYDRDNEISAEFSKNCNGRIIWGGDETVRNIRKLLMNERGIEVVFSDRYSICVIDPSSIDSISGSELNRLAELFYNDTFLMDQNACSSPHLIVWLGKDNRDAKEKFWRALFEVVSKKYKLENISVVDKYVGVCEDSIELDDIKSFKKIGNLIYRMEIDNLPDNIDNFRKSCGFFYEYDTEDINSISHIVNNKYQTLTYFGVDKNLLFSFVVNNNLRGIDRIVPIGQALDIGIIWDGYDIIRSLSRIVDVK